MIKLEAVLGNVEAYDARSMRCYPVSRRVNHVANDGASAERGSNNGKVGTTLSHAVIS